MDDGFRNVYDDQARAEAYAALDFPGTYHLAFRDLPALLQEFAPRGGALDFGCGAGRSTRFLGSLGYRPVLGVDIAEQMVAQARARDPHGAYRVVRDGNLDGLPPQAFDLALAAFTFDNIPTRERKTALLRALARVVKAGGCVVNLVSSPEIYLHEWASFSTEAFPENRLAGCGDEVRIVMLDVPDRRPVVDVLWTDEAYREIYSDAGLDVLRTHRPLARGDEPIAWVSETSVAPWVIYVLRPAET